MSDCFVDTPDLTPFTAVAANVRLDELNNKPTAIADPQLRRDAELSATFDWRHVDMAPDDLLNRILWRSMKGTAAPYPEWAVGAADDDEPPLSASGSRR
jgi:hypothetical protein